MISIRCSDPNCPQYDVEFHMMGDHPYVCCGGCGIHLAPYDLRLDPELPSGFPVMEANNRSEL